MFNTDIEIIYRKPATETLFLKNKFYGTLFHISEPEYEIIRFYADYPNAETVQQHFADKYELPREILDQLLARATNLNLLVTDEYTKQKERDVSINQKRAQQLTYIVYYCNQLLAYFQICLVPKFKGNIHYFQLFTIQSTRTLPRQPVSSNLCKWIGITFTTLLIISSYTLICADNTQWSWQRVLEQSPSLQGTLLFIAILFCAFFSTFLHEAAHYFLYRYYGGMPSEIGVALMIGIVPVIYINTNSLYIWDSKRARMYVTGAGIMMDVWQIIGLGAIYLNTSIPVMLFLTSWMLVFVTIRFLTNINVFIPGTDGYFLYCDLVGKPDLYQESLSKSRQVWGDIQKRHYKKVSREDWGSILYILLSLGSIAMYYFFFAALVLIPLFIHFL